MTDVSRVRRALEAEFGALSEPQYVKLLGDAILDKSNASAIAQANAPLFRKPTTMEDYQRVGQAYPKSVESVVRELSVYTLVSKSGDVTVEGDMVFGVGIAIVDHILKAGELSA